MDWTGNKKSAFVCNGASNHSEEERETNDYYATEPKAIDILLNEGKIKLSSTVLEPACGEGHLSKRLEECGYKVKSSDIINRGYGEVKDFFDIKEWNYPLDYAIAIATAIEALEKQIPKKPILKSGVSLIHINKGDKPHEWRNVQWQDWVCPECGWFVGQRYNATQCKPHDQRKCNYCNECGQAIDWRDEE